MYHLQLKLINLPTYPTPQKEILKNCSSTWESSLIFYTVWLKIYQELIMANCVKQKNGFQWSFLRLCK